MKAGAVVLIVIGVLLFGCTAEQKDCGTEKQYVCGEDGVTYTNDCYAKNAGVNVDYQGTCTASGASETCVDTDNGKNVLEFGTTSKASASFNDSCDPTTTIVVYEYFCEGNSVTSLSLTCPSGMECSAGKCAEAQPSCADSDNGQNTGVKGTASAEGKGSTDVCYDGGTVKEYYCSNGAVKESMLECGQGEACQDGQCVSAVACSDTDGGYTVFERGTAREGNELYTDYCTNSYTLEEYYCSQEGVSSYTVNCGSGTSCVNGECVSDICTDTDDGQDRYERGNTYKGTDGWTDYCIDSDTVKEYYCSGDSVKTTDLGCSSGYYCDDGECVEEEEYSCRDTDDGVDAREYGTVTKGSGSWSDYCVDTSTVQEMYCDGNQPENTRLSCGSGYYCSGGECRANACRDSDGGVMRNILGTVTSGTSEEEDSCQSIYSLLEQYCNGNVATETAVDCLDYGEYCYKGVCSDAQCTDTDGGKDYVNKGEITTSTDNGFSSSNEDYCVNDRTLKEYYCSGVEMKDLNVECRDIEVCYNGECTLAQCRDSDGGKAYTVVGTVTQGAVSNTDTCVSSMQLREYFCTDGMIASTTYACSCSSGRCIGVIR